MPVPLGDPAAPGPPTREVVTVLRCPTCSTENSLDSVFCRICSRWLVRQWEAVLVKTTPPITVEFKLGRRGRPVVFNRQFSLRTSVEVSLQITGGPGHDIIAHAKDPSGEVVAGSLTKRIRSAGRLAWQVNEPGEYTIVLDNSFSRFSSKTVRVTLAGF